MSGYYLACKVTVDEPRYTRDEVHVTQLHVMTTSWLASLLDSYHVWNPINPNEKEGYEFHVRICIYRP